ncbi:hypoxia induced protein conserved region-domain-containing protein, partial [Amylocystis lapponica]
ETYSNKFVRKFKEQPLVPLGAAATTVALVLAMVKMRQGKSKSMNYWLRARVVAQGLTIAAVVGGSYALGQTQTQKDAAAAAAADQDARIERAGFEARMREAEEAHRFE